MAMTDAEKAQRAVERELLKRQRDLNQATLRDAREGVSPDQLLADLAEARAHAQDISQTQRRLFFKEGQIGLVLRPFWCDHLLSIALFYHHERLVEALLPEWLGQDESLNAIADAVRHNQPDWAVRLVRLLPGQAEADQAQFLYEIALDKADLSTLTYLLTHLSPTPAFALVDRALWRHTLTERDVANLTALFDAGAPFSDDEHPAQELLARLLAKGQFDLADRVWASARLDPEEHTTALHQGLQHALAIRHPVWVDRLIGLLPTEAGHGSWQALRDSLKSVDQGMDLIARQARHLGVTGLRDCWLSLTQDRDFDALDRMATLVPPLWSQTLMDMSTPAERTRLPQTFALLRQQGLAQRPAATPSRPRRRS